MELNPLVFPAPAPSYTHETLNNGSFLETMPDLADLLKSGANRSWIVKAKMLYVPKFDLYINTPQADQKSRISIGGFPKK